MVHGVAALPPVARATDVLAHGVGGRKDLPIPFSYAVGGAAVALVVSFVVLALAWRTSRFRGDAAGRPLPAVVTRIVDSRGFAWTVRVVGLVLFAYTVMCLVFAPDLATNPAAGLVFVIFWLGLIPLSLVFGPAWRLLNPIRTFHLLLCRALRQNPEEGPLNLPAGVGYWPAAVGLFLFAWLELVEPNRATTPVLRAFVLGYVGVHFVLATLYGSRWLDRGDAFEALSGLLGRLSPFGRRTDGVIVVRNPLANLDGLPSAPGLAATVCVLLGSTAYDSLTGSPSFARIVAQSALGPRLAGTLGLGAAVAVVLVAYSAAALLTGRVTGQVTGGATSGVRRLDRPGTFAHSIVPIVLGYLVAHYLTFFVLEGQQTLIFASDPFSNGSNWFGTATRGVDPTIALYPGVVATIQVLAVITGHILGVFSAHDRAVRLLPPRHAVAGQVPLMTLMVAYTVAGLLLLFSS